MSGEKLAVVLTEELSVDEIDEQLAELQAKRVTALANQKNTVKVEIDKLIDNSKFSLLDLYPEYTKVVVEKPEPTHVTINKKQYKLPKEGIGKSIEKALKSAGFKVADFDRAKVIEKFRED